MLKKIWAHCEQIFQHQLISSDTTVTRIPKCLNHVVITLGFHRTGLNWLLNMFHHKHAIYASTSLSKCDDWDDAAAKVPCVHIYLNLKKNQGLFFSFGFVWFHFVSFHFVSFRFSIFSFGFLALDFFIVSFLNFFRFVFQTMEIRIDF
jgi:hypothetical protein